MREAQRTSHKPTTINRSQQQAKTRLLCLAAAPGLEIAFPLLRRSLTMLRAAICIAVLGLMRARSLPLPAQEPSWAVNMVRSQSLRVML